MREHDEPKVDGQSLYAVLCVHCFCGSPEQQDDDALHMHVGAGCGSVSTSAASVQGAGCMCVHHRLLRYSCQISRDVLSPPATPPGLQS